MKKSYIGSAVAAIALMLGAAGAANAFTITAGDIKFTIDNYDSGTTGYDVGTNCTTAAACDAVIGIAPASGSAGSFNPSADTLGIFSVLSISNLTTGKSLFLKERDGYLTGVFGNLVDTNVVVTAATTTANATGGYFAVYQNSQDYDPTFGPKFVDGQVDLNAGKYTGITGGDLYLSGVFVPGVIAGNDTITYQSIFANTSFAGNGAGYIDLTGGSALGTFNNNAFGQNRDLQLTTTFNAAIGATAAAGWTVVSAGQAQAAAIPEPGSLALLGMGALVAGLARRRKQAAK